MRWRVALLAVGLLACSPPRAAGPQPVAVAIEARARAIAPGEPVRVDVRTPRPLERLGGVFLGEPIFFVRAATREGRERWSGWAVVPLDHAPGPTEIAVEGTAADGAPAAGRLALTIVAKAFPEEKLGVASKYVATPPEVEARLAREGERKAAIYATRRDSPPVVAFARPVGGEPTSIFGTRRTFNGEPRSPHPGIDLRAATGTPVVAAGRGVVALADDLYFSGGTVILDHGGGLFTVYAHLSRLDVAEGQDVGIGQRLGSSGATGRVTGPHLHWGAKVGDSPFDPEALLDPVFSTATDP